MATTNKKDTKSAIVVRFPEVTTAHSASAALQGAAHRSGSGIEDPFLPRGAFKIQASFDLSSRARGAVADGAVTPRTIDDKALVALEASDGFTLFVRADQLDETIKRIRPELDGDERGLSIAALGGRTDDARGVGDWIWSKLTVFDFDSRDLIEDAKKYAREKLGAKAQEWAQLSLTWAGTKALMWAIENRLEREPGLYRWGTSSSGSPELKDVSAQQLELDAQQGPLLIFIHGTGSSTSGSFEDLRASMSSREWEALASTFGSRIYGYEHRTFSESPLENALDLAKRLPSHARISIVTHSRGGLVGDLMCLAEVDRSWLEFFQRGQEGMKEADAHDQAVLLELGKELRRKRLSVDRYVRVAAPARGTRLASDNLDLFLSSLLWLIGKVPALAGNPIYSAVKRIVLEIAKSRTNPSLVPGIEAMLPESPLATLLARASRCDGIAIAVIAGDIEGGGLLRRLGVLFTDWMFFDQVQNDLVVDTDSMYAGIAINGGAQYVFDQGTNVSHFRYFANSRTRRALQTWLTTTSITTDLPDFSTLPDASKRADAAERAIRRSRRGKTGAGAPGARPRVLIIPGIMGSHLERVESAQTPLGDGDRIWFDFPQLAVGGLSGLKWSETEGDRIRAEDLFERSYGDLESFLEKEGYDVRRFPYDWRKPILVEAQRLVIELKSLLVSELPIKIVAHSMGGLVVRGAFASEPSVWKTLAARDTTQILLLGTPNHGSHSIVANLLGKGDVSRALARLDVKNDLQNVVDIIGGFPGALHLLPAPDFKDVEQTEATDYYDPGLWKTLKGELKDFWFGNGKGATPDAKVLSEVKRDWEKIAKFAFEDYPERASYVFGCADETACDLQRGLRLKLLMTEKGDGSVTWESGKLPALTKDGEENRSWYMPVEHGALASSDEHFDAIRDLLKTGATNLLSRKAPTAKRALTKAQPYEPGPTPYPTDDELENALLGGRLLGKRQKRTPVRNALAISVRAIDIAFLQSPLVCGHCSDDVIAGAEKRLDRRLDYALTKRAQLGAYAGRVGTSTIVLQPRGGEEVRRGTQLGALIVGLGELGNLTTEELVDTVRAGVIQFLVHQMERSLEAVSRQSPPLKLSSMLIGINSSMSITIKDSIHSITLGVVRANDAIREVYGAGVRVVEQLEFVELYLDNAITAAEVVAQLKHSLPPALEATAVTITLPDEGRLSRDESVLPRLSAAINFGYWPRLHVTGHLSAVQSESQDKSRPGLPDALKFLFVGERARAESLYAQRQPGLVESLVASAIGSYRYAPDFGATLFRLVVPLALQSSIRQGNQMVLVLDDYTANIPWEMFELDGQPIANRMSLIRQFVTADYRHRVRPAREDRAFVVGNPATTGFAKVFGDKFREPGSLLGAAQEGEAVLRLLGSEDIGYVVETALASRPDDDATRPQALEVINKLFKQPYRIVHVASHGLFNEVGVDGIARTGALLSDGLLISAAEIDQLEFVPDLVFLNCCHLGTMGEAPKSPNRLAASIARGLIDIGVRCVIVAGWAVDDLDARKFAEVFYSRFLRDNLPFGRAVHEARQAIFKDGRGSNTWGAYQAYGDPAFVMNTKAKRDGGDSPPKPVAIEQIVASIRRLRMRHRADQDAKSSVAIRQEFKDVIRDIPEDWRESSSVNYEIGLFLADLGPDAFSDACAAFERALRCADGGDTVPLKALQQIANLESRRGERDRNADLIQSAIDRLNFIDVIVSGNPRPDSDNEAADASKVSGDPERCGLLGSAWKRRAIIYCDTPEPERAANVREALVNSRSAYARGEQPSKNGRALYCLINRLQLDALLHFSDKASNKLPLLAKAQEAEDDARTRFDSTLEPFDAIMPVDALLAQSLLKGTLVADQDALIRAYQEASIGVSMNARNSDSVRTQLKSLHMLSGALRLPESVVGALRNIATALGTEVGGGAPAPVPPVPKSRKPSPTKKVQVTKPGRKKTPSKKTSRRPK